MCVCHFPPCEIRVELKLCCCFLFGVFGAFSGRLFIPWGRFQCNWKARQRFQVNVFIYCETFVMSSICILFLEFEKFFFPWLTLNSRIIFYFFYSVRIHCTLGNVNVVEEMRSLLAWGHQYSFCLKTRTHPRSLVNFISTKKEKCVVWRRLLLQLMKIKWRGF